MEGTNLEEALDLGGVLPGRIVKLAIDRRRSLETDRYELASGIGRESRDHEKHRGHQGKDRELEESVQDW